MYDGILKKIGELKLNILVTGFVDYYSLPQALKNGDLIILNSQSSKITYFQTPAKLIDCFALKITV